MTTEHLHGEHCIEWDDGGAARLNCEPAIRAEATAAERDRLLAIADRLFEAGIFTVEKFRQLATMSIEYGPMSVERDRDNHEQINVTQNVRIIQAAEAVNVTLDRPQS